MKIGAQLYTIRDYIQTVDDVSKSFKKIADIGYQAVQVSGIGPIKPEELRDIAKENGLEIVITHINPERVLNETEQVIVEHKIFGCNRIGIGSLPDRYKTDLNGYRQFVKDFSVAAKKMAEHGMKFYYHNHEFEFLHFEGTTPYDMMIQETNPDEWAFLPDTYWIQYAGRCPAKQIEQLKGRTEVIHIKDMAIRDRKQVMAPIFEGNLCFDEIFEACEKAGVVYAMVEQDDCYGKDPFDELKISFDNLKKAGY
ncbi:sugar phosphate isomerase/epimerase [Paludicola sp. MB14-C6]|uniref:sugar phosphate isomerase/epimerase family protein n=1 Tax=Paludihabitans sp. MB14-C6 TaxID=3070656 RepID=UPI0027DC74ED|nr:sugar phosphate isomerase/epimerase [Paludicola sp. MB14-C6]WMJ23260.1 sugar phosphate isomerase/epimerase [Paludicola sp. MB14-C6]